MDGWMEGWKVDGWQEGWIDGQMCGWVNRRVEGRREGVNGGWVDGRIHRWTDEGWVERLKDG